MLLTKADRCDRCPAQAFTIARRGFHRLIFCAHHGRAYFPALVADGWIVWTPWDRTGG